MVAAAALAAINAAVRGAAIWCGKPFETDVMGDEGSVADHWP
jgi:hypothetical protein